MQKSFLSFETLGYSLVILITVPFAWEANKLPPGVFDPLGSGAVPLAVSVCILVLCVLGLLRQWLTVSRHNAAIAPTNEQENHSDPGTSDPSDGEGSWEKTPQLVVILLLATIIYCLAFQMRLANFTVLSTLFLWIAIFVLSDRSRIHLLRSFVVALVFSLIFYFIFTKIFVVDLPGT